MSPITGNPILNSNFLNRSTSSTSSPESITAILSTSPAIHSPLNPIKMFPDPLVVQLAPTFARNPFNDCEIFNLEIFDTTNVPPTTITTSTNSWDMIELLALDNFRNWMVCFCIVNFDLELGQAMDVMYPPSSDLTNDEMKNICFSAFPDSNSFDVGETVFNFRIRCSSKSGLVSSGPTADAGFLYGYVFFRQKRDSRIRRGFFQKSVVLLSPYPYVGLFSKLVSILGPAYFEVGKPMLEAACHDITSWRPPSPGKTFELPFLGSIIQVEIPYPNSPQLLETSPFDMSNYRPDTQILASLPPTPTFAHFRDMLKDLWICWELMLFAEPIVLMAPDPKICSEAVLELVDLINPIPYCGDYRPYFTIQDTDFKSFVTKTQPPSNIIIGVTNPYFTKALQHWPNIIKVGRPKSRKTNGSSWRGFNVSSLDFIQGVRCKRKSVIAKDKAVLKLFAEAITRGYPSETPQLKPFKTDKFLKSLQEHGPQIPFKTKNFASSDIYINFYTQFLKSGNFATWLRLRTIEAQNELRKRYLQVLCEDDVRKWMIGKHEMELVDLLVRVKDELKLSKQNYSQTSSVVVIPSSVIRDRNGVSPSIPTAQQYSENLPEPLDTPSIKGKKRKKTEEIEDLHIKIKERYNNISIENENSTIKKIAKYMINVNYLNISFNDPLMAYCIDLSNPSALLKRLLKDIQKMNREDYDLVVGIFKILLVVLNFFLIRDTKSCYVSVPYFTRLLRQCKTETTLINL
nr:9371_t:CDS:10 [Entrophospora candida]